MPKEIMEKKGNRKHTVPEQVATTRRRNAQPKDRLTAKVLAAEKAGYGCHYGQFVADHPDALNDWTPGEPVPEISKKVYECICPGCGGKFTTTNRLRRYCSDVCKMRKDGAKHRDKKKSKEGEA